MSNHQTFNLWTTQVQIFDEFISDANIYQQLKEDSLISKTVQGQSVSNMPSAQAYLTQSVSAAVMNYCVENNINYNNLKLHNLQKGCLYKYDETKVGNHLYEPHHDMVEGFYITAIYYIDSSYQVGQWVGGELTIYKQLTFADYPNNTINILPKQNRLIIFPGFTVHRVKPYFGDIPRTSLVFGWSVVDGENNIPLIV